MDKMQWKVLKPATEVWANEWIRVLEIRVQLPTGVKTQFYMMDARDGVAVLIIDDQRRAILMRQFRPALEAVILELPGGEVGNGETHYDAALRELSEEAGLYAKDLHYLGSFYRNPAKDTGSIHVYFARDAGVASPHQERYESLETVRVPLDDLFAQVLNREIRDAATIFAVLMLRSLLERGGIQL